jgi:hypothetical protein
VDLIISFNHFIFPHLIPWISNTGLGCSSVVGSWVWSPAPQKNQQKICNILRNAQGAGDVETEFPAPRPSAARDLSLSRAEVSKGWPSVTTTWRKGLWGKRQTTDPSVRISLQKWTLGVLRNSIKAPDLQTTIPIPYAGLCTLAKIRNQPRCPQTRECIKWNTTHPLKR